MIKKIALGLLGILLLLQFFQIDKSPLPVNPILDIKTVLNPPAEVHQLLQSACYDCHSNLTNYPKYAHLQPLGWWLQGHVREGRRELNFSEFGSIPRSEMEDVLRHCAEEIEEGKMPLKSYRWLHPESDWTDSQRQAVLDWLRNPIPADLSELSSKGF